MVILGAIEGRSRKNFSDYRLFVLLLRLFLRDECRRHLLGGVIKNHRAILTAYIRPLPIQLGWIMGFPKKIEQLLVTDHEGVVFDKHDFGVPGAIAANLFVGWTFCSAAA